MSMSKLERRLQILIDEDRYRQLAAHARTQGTSVAAVVRQAIDQVIRPDQARRRRAWQRIAAMEPMEVPDDPRDLKEWIYEDRLPDL